MPLLFLLFLFLFIIAIIFLFCVKRKTSKSKKYSLQNTNSVEFYSRSDSLIPKVLYQTVKDKNDVGEDVYNFSENMKKLNPEYSFEYFDDEDQRDFIKYNFDDRTLKAYDKVKPKAFKADLWRYCMLYIRGGVYLDAGADVKKPFREFIGDTDEFVSVKDMELSTGDVGIYQAFIASVQRHPFLEQAIKDCVENIENELIGESCLEITGPIAFGYSMNKVLGRHKLEKFDIGLNNYILKFKLLYNKWAGYIVDENDREIFYKHYPLSKFFAINSGGDFHYSVLWRLAYRFKDPKHLYN